ncbi:hypothetical protein [Companilactobacillus kedongensis]|uniref:hypothetical protein n=1 Tax=Companilactobacillus kedongensis TaxID=2486004 RepID=UPI000F772029|nr:hypothetical protein [Companilactobacillus kedongensis]
MKNKGKFIYSLMLSIVGIVFFVLASGSQVKAADSEMSVSVQDAVLKADTNAYVVDQTTKSKISSNNTVLDDQAASYVNAESVNPGDSLEFNYLMNFVSGEATANMTATIKLPDNVTFATGTIGKVVYLSSDGKKTTSVDIPDTDLDKKTLTVPIDDIGTGKDYASARIVLSAKAGAAGKTVDQSHIDYEADNYDDVADTPSFDIKDASNSIVATADNSSVGTYELDDFNLTGTMDYKKDDGVVFENKNMYIYATIDGKEQVIANDTQSADKTFNLLMKGLPIGDHKITVQVVQPDYKSTGETIVSNILTYDVNVATNSLIITKDKAFDGDGYKVNDNNPVDLKGTYKHADGSPAHGTSRGLSISYQITSRADTDTPNVQDAISGTDNDNGNIDIPLNPLFYNKTSAGTILDQALSFDDYIAKYGYKGLEVGKNVVTITLTDSKGHESDPTKFVINVPDFTPEFTVDTEDVKSDSASNNTIGTSYNVPTTVKYPDGYKFSTGNIFGFNKLNGIEKPAFSSPPLDNVSEGDQIFSVYIDSDDNYGNIDKDVPLAGALHFKDVYGRTAKDADYNVVFRSHYVDINVGTNLKFKNMKESMLVENDTFIQRDGDWNISVNSYNSPWLLRVNATPFYKQVDNGSSNIKLNANMSYLQPSEDNSPGRFPIIGSESNTEIDQMGPGLVEKDQKMTRNVSEGWNDTDGILLRPSYSFIGYAGTYTSTMTWETVDSL